MKYVEPRPYAKPEAAAARLLEIAKAIGADRRGMIPVSMERDLLSQDPDDISPRSFN